MLKKIHNKLFLPLLLIVFSNNLFGEVYSKLPTSLDELIESSNLIVIGTVTKIVDKRKFYGYDNKIQPNSYEKGDFQLGLPLIDSSINVIETLKGDVEFSGLKKIIILRTFENIINENNYLKQRRGKKVFFLKRNPDNKTYGLSSLAHEINLDNLVDTDGHPSFSLHGINYELPFVSTINEKDFIEKIKLHEKQKNVD